MKKEQGITLIALIVYIILMTFVVAGISAISASFYGNVNEFDRDSKSAVAYSKFNMYFLNDIKNSSVEIEDVGDNYVIISYVRDVEESKSNSSGVGITGRNVEYVEYSVQDNILYREKVKICDNVKDSSFRVNYANNTITINLKIGDYEKTTTYAVEDPIASGTSRDDGIIEI